MTNEQMNDPDLDSVQITETGDDLAGDQVEPARARLEIDRFLKPDHDHGLFPARPKPRQRDAFALKRVPDHFEFMTAAWRKRRGKRTGQNDAPRPRRGLRARLGVAPYHRNPAHVLLAHPGVIAALLIALALMLRIVEVQQNSYTSAHNARSYLVLGGQIAHHGVYASDQPGAGGTRPGPTAYFGPAYPYLLGALDWITGHAPTGAAQVHVAQLTQAVLGAVVVGLIGLIALELFGVDMALLAMALAAIYPVMIEMSSVLTAETLMTVFLLAAVWATLRMRRSGDPLRWVIGAGVLTGLAALTHSVAILLLIPLGIAAISARPVVGRRVVAGPIVLVVATLLTLSPWLIRDGVVMHRFVPITDASGITLAGTYNSSSAHGQPPYGWHYYRGIPEFAPIARRASHLTETQLDGRLQNQAFTYIAHHPASVPGAFWHNSLRLLELQGSQAWQASANSLGLSRGSAQIGVICFWALCALALLGLAGPPGLRAPGWLWLVPVVMWLSAALVDGQTPGYRAAIDPFIVLLAARGIARVARWMRKQPAVPSRTERVAARA